MKSSLVAAGAILGLGLVLAVPAGAQTPPYVDSSCGTWQGDTWVANASCASDVHKHERVSGTITIVKGHLVTVQQSDRPGNRRFARLKNELHGCVAVGRQIVNGGYWDNGTFYATLLTTGPTTPG